MGKEAVMKLGTLPSLVLDMIFLSIRAKGNVNSSNCKR